MLTLRNEEPWRRLAPTQEEKGLIALRPAGTRPLLPGCGLKPERVECWGTWCEFTEPSRVWLSEERSERGRKEEKDPGLKRSAKSSVTSYIFGDHSRTLWWLPCFLQSPPRWKWPPLLLLLLPPPPPPGRDLSTDSVWSARRSHQARDLHTEPEVRWCKRTNKMILKYLLDLE